MLVPLAAVGEETRLRLLVPRATASEVETEGAGPRGLVRPRLGRRYPADVRQRQRMDDTEFTALGLGGEFEMVWYPRRRARDCRSAAAAGGARYNLGPASTRRGTPELERRAGGAQLRTRRSITFKSACRKTRTWCPQSDRLHGSSRSRSGNRRHRESGSSRLAVLCQARPPASRSRSAWAAAARPGLRRKAGAPGSNWRGSSVVGAARQWGNDRRQHRGVIGKSLWETQRDGVRQIDQAVGNRSAAPQGVAAAFSDYFIAGRTRC